MVSTAWTLRDRYDVAEVDVFSGAAFIWAEAVCWTLRLAQKPFVLVLRGGNLPAFAKRWPRRVRRVLNSAAAVTTPSGYLLERMQPYCDRLRLLPNPVRVKHCPYRLRANPQPKLIWLRAFHGIYNPAMAADVVSILANDSAQVRLTMFGPDKGDGSLQAAIERAERLGITGRIEFAGAIPKVRVPEELSTRDIFLNTTNIDNAPISVLEAMAAGLCIVSTNVGGIPYLLTDEVDALLTPPGDAAAMACAVRRVLAEPGLAEKLSCNARRKAEQFDWSVVLPEWQALLRAVAIRTRRQ
jgi:glycosyltransferase involved in cell wall biosynthesis